MIGISVSAADSNAVYDENSGFYSVVETVAVSEVSAGSVCDGVLMKDDVLLSISLNGKKQEITRRYHAIDVMLDMRVGDEVTFEIIRGTENLSVSVTVTEDSIVAY